MKVMAFGSCMSNLTIAHLKAYGATQIHSVHHNRSDNFVRYFIDKTDEIVPKHLLDAALEYKEETEADARQYVINQYPDGVGYHSCCPPRRRRKRPCSAAWRTRNWTSS